MSLVTIPLGDLMRVLPFKGHDDIRYYLNGVFVAPYNGHALLVATNGHWLGIYESLEAVTDAEHILDLPDWFVEQIDDAVAPPLFEGLPDEDDILMPRLARDGDSVIVEDVNAHVVIGHDGKEALVKPGAPFIDGKFPDWRKVLPDPEDIAKGLMAPVMPEYLGSLHKAIPDPREHPLFCYHHAADPQKGPLLFRFGNLPHFVVALMPRSDNDKEPAEWPAWMKKEKQE